ncbi:hypothetical protein BT67DRAFT_376302 [Trichocladium antarcticum]|uniref:Uncharacterized protein n=1 Tax=Trichocladium antarcticum TaxID=1450529 RepID=A0AAN6ZFM6_9PEZI|nr:hypothetical protein BT67DRAFT_376302 [Trichocladium antarcticum]
MDRGRTGGRGRAAKKRATLPSHQTGNPSHPFSDSAAPTTPVASTMPQRLPSTAPQRGGKARTANLAPHRASSPIADDLFRLANRAERPARSATSHSSFSFESHPPAAAIMVADGPSDRKRSRTLDFSYDGAADDEAHSKGGHSLRKRTRIDYTQEMIDDDRGASAAKAELAAKPNTTPTVRGRKRKNALDGSDDEAEDLGANPKRRRADKSPMPARPVSSRRRHPSKKSLSDVPPYVEQPSDNDVQDTILVGVSMDAAGVPSAEESDHSSVPESESRATSSDDGDVTRAQAQPPTPQVQPSESIEDAVSVVPDDEAIDSDLVAEQADDKSGIAPAQISLTIKSEQPEQALQAKSRKITLVVPRAIAAPEPQPAQAKQGASQEQVAEPSQHEPAPEPTIENLEPAGPPAPEPTPAEQPTAPPPPQAAGAAAPQPAVPPVPAPRPPRRPRPTGPARLRRLEGIYNSATPFASYLSLTPYEQEDTILPGPYTEWVHPAQPGKQKPEPTPIPTPIPTPTPTPSPVEPLRVEVEWDATRPLKTRQFFALFRQETKRREQNGEPSISMVDFNNQCVRRYKAAQGQAPASVAPPAITTPPVVSSAAAVVSRAEAPSTAPEPETRPNSQEAESRLPTAAPSPAPAEEDLAQEDGAEEEQDAEEVADGLGRPGSPIGPVEVTRNPARQYLFPKIRDPAEFVEAFDGWQNMHTDHLYDTVAAAVETLHAYQQEYNELRRILDDEDNAKRRQANDKTILNWENRQKADEPPQWRRHFDDAVKGPGAFEVRGVRAPKPYIDDPVLEHQREEDRIMAQAYGFKHNTHPTQVGRQNPEEQRWEMPENRLRKRTEKGAELADENVIEGKRTRKPRYVSDQSKDPSRSGTPTSVPALGLGRRQKRKTAAAMDGDDIEGPEQAPSLESFSELPRKGRAARGRGVASLQEEEAMVVAEADNNQTEDEAMEDRPKATRRRGRGAAAIPEPPTSVPAGFGGEFSKPKRVRGSKGQANYQTMPEIASSSFYSIASTTATQADSRPSTASSDGTAHTAETVESTYSLRDKRKRNFVLENDPELEPRPQRRGRGPAKKKQEAAEPKKRGPRKKDTAAPPLAAAPAPGPPPASPPSQPIATKFFHSFMSGPTVADTSSGPQPVPAAPAPAPFLHTFNAAPAFPPGAPPPPPPAAVKKPITKIKLTNNGASSQTASPAPPPSNGASSSSSKPGAKGSRANKSAASADAKAAAVVAGNANGNGNGNGNGDFDKPYAEMTKSEKMSWSMRRRWASGEMQGAVEKRRTTLANKKAEKASTNPADAATGQTTDSGSAGTSDPATPVSSAGQGLLALPPGPILRQAPPQPQNILQQPPPFVYAMPPGAPHGSMEYHY